MVLHILVLGGGVYALIRLNKLPEDEERFKVNAKHVFKTLGLIVFSDLLIFIFQTYFLTVIFLTFLSL